MKMRLIPLTKGQSAIVDDQDYADLSQFKWYAHWDHGTNAFYAQRGVKLPNGKWTVELMHRRILGLKHGDKRQGDHIYHQTLDNRRCMIRIVTKSQNQHNQQNRKGYYFDKKSRKYRAEIRVNGALQRLGRYKTPAEAKAIYLVAKAIYHPSAPAL